MHQISLLTLLYIPFTWHGLEFLFKKTGDNIKLKVKSIYYEVIWSKLIKDSEND